MNRWILVQPCYELLKFLLSAGMENDNRGYIILGSITGTKPGSLLPGGKAILPLNCDFFMNLVITFINTPIFVNFKGTLDDSGSAWATFDTLGPIVGTQGITLNFAYALDNPWDFASNSVAIDIVP